MMKKVLWVCNIMLPVIAKEINLPYSNREGWLTGILNALTQGEENTEVLLGICFPVSAETIERIGRDAIWVQGVPCYGFAEDLVHPENYDVSLEKRFSEILEDFKPDMIHVFGTEFPHALAAIKTFDKPERTLIGIQGLCSEIAKVYMAGIPEKVSKSVSFRDFIRKDSLKQQQEKFRIRGEREKEIIRLSGHITGRTSFDKEKTAKMNPNAVYHPMNETMRSAFYTGEWNRDACERHSIFMGQGDYPLKGFHFMLEAMPQILSKYPNAKLYLAGNSIMEHHTVKDKIKLSAYGKYLLSVMNKYDLKDKVVVLGKLSEEKMKERFLHSEVFVCPSVLENSPNTIGEAMLLGVPVVAANVGGIPDMITNEKDGLLFACGDVDALAKAVYRIFDEEDLAETLSHAAKERAKLQHDGHQNYRRLLEIYEIMGRT